jgi:hypothetical protein
MRIRRSVIDYVIRSRLHDLVIATLSELGVTNPQFDAIHMRTLVKDGCYAGHVLRCEHIRVFFSASRQIDLFGPGDMLLRKVDVEQIAA